MLRNFSGYNDFWLRITKRKNGKEFNFQMHIFLSSLTNLLMPFL